MKYIKKENNLNYYYFMIIFIGRLDGSWLWTHIKYIEDGSELEENWAIMCI